MIRTRIVNSIEEGDRRFLFISNCGNSIYLNHEKGKAICIVSDGFISVGTVIKFEEKHFQRFYGTVEIVSY